MSLKFHVPTEWEEKATFVMLRLRICEMSQNGCFTEVEKIA